MPTPEAVTQQLVDIVERVLGSDADDVVPTAKLKDDLGADSLTLVEIGEELGRRFGIYLTDETIDGLHTVNDAVNAVTRHDGSPPPRGAHPPIPKNFVAAPFKEPVYNDDGYAVAAAVAAPSDTPIAADHLVTGSIDPEEAEKRAWGAVKWLAVAGAAIGAILALGISAVVNASGMQDVSLPPLPTTATAAPTPTDPTPPRSPTPTSTFDPTPDPTLTAEKTRVAPGERFILSGAMPELDKGATLQVQVREAGQGWDDFPVQVKTRDGGEFKTELYTSRTGEREFRLLHEETGKTTPTVKVQIG